MRGHQVKLVVFSTGERFPMLLNRSDGIPSFDATAFSMVMYRNKGIASATLEKILRAVGIFYDFCDDRQISLNARLEQGKILSLGELESLAVFCDQKNQHIFRKPLHFHKLSDRKEIVVTPHTAETRIRYILAFIQWQVDRFMQTVDFRKPLYQTLKSEIATFTSRLKARISKGKPDNSNQSRIALSKDEQNELWEIIHPDSSRNPWKGSHARVRNQLIVCWLIELGLRRGELLGIKISDINFTKNEVLIARRADDAEDPRQYEPNTKTLSRTLPLSTALGTLTRRYIIEQRIQYPGSRQHPFLIIANGGKPLTLRQMNKIFEVFSKNNPSLPTIFPHLFRHTFNYNFSVTSDKLKTPEQTEIKARSHVMGWSEKSNTAQKYAKREVRRKAEETLLKAQEDFKR